MKRNILFALSAIVLGVAGYVGYQQVSASSESDLFLANVEALSTMEYYDSEDCGGGPFYSDVGSTRGSVLGRFHVSNKIDVEIDFDYIYCHAYGNGKKVGSNGPVWVDESDPVEVPCTNNHIDVDFY